jgi:hypothetical protein
VTLSKDFWGSAVRPGFLAPLATILIGPYPPDAAALDSLKKCPALRSSMIISGSCIIVPNI